jgi:hypothetical protein
MATKCDLMLPGKMKDMCQKTFQEGPYAPQNGTPAPSSGGTNSLWDILTGSYSPFSLRHFMIRVVEVIVGGAMVIVAIKTLMNSSPTTKVIVQGVKKVAG